MVANLPESRVLGYIIATIPSPFLLMVICTLHSNMWNGLCYYCIHTCMVERSDYLDSLFKSMKYRIEMQDFNIQ